MMVETGMAGVDEISRPRMYAAEDPVELRTNIHAIFKQIEVDCATVVRSLPRYV